MRLPLITEPNQNKCQKRTSHDLGGLQTNILPRRKNNFRRKFIYGQSAPHIVKVRLGNNAGGFHDKSLIPVLGTEN